MGVLGPEAVVEEMDGRAAGQCDLGGKTAMGAP